MKYMPPKLYLYIVLDILFFLTWIAWSIYAIVYEYVEILAYQTILLILLMFWFANSDHNKIG
jgi:hypothetical protein